ncbi:Uncharacterised protein [Bifidobacterium longum subsp. infantis]|uniref:Uncharacterized protein n=3 Tax=Bifidobacterium longum TaxID=216816 RepID=A0A564S0Y1_BIFLI|nr:Uncharacterised protein [Bifidobacterium longum subsp. infantis]
MRHESRSQADIARATGGDRSTISREMRRNSFRVGVCFRFALSRRLWQCETKRCQLFLRPSGIGMNFFHSASAGCVHRIVAPLIPICFKCIVSGIQLDVAFEIKI